MNVSKIMDKISQLAGHPATVGVAFMLIALWFGLGPLFHFSEAYQMIINTGTTIITFLLGFIILSSGNKGDRATQIKLDVIIKGLDTISDKFMGIEKLTPEEIEELVSAELVEPAEPELNHQAE